MRELEPNELNVVNGGYQLTGLYVPPPVFALPSWPDIRGIVFLPGFL